MVSDCMKGHVGLSEAVYVQNPPGNTNEPLPGATHVNETPRTILSPEGTDDCLFAPSSVQAHNVRSSV